MSLKTTYTQLIALVTTGGLLLAKTASAEPPAEKCVDPARPNPIYIAGSTALKPFLATMAQLLAKESPAYTIVYQGQGSCVGVSSIFSDDPNKRVMRDVPAVGAKAANYAVFFRADGTPQECGLEPSGNVVDIGASDVYAKSCGQADVAGVTDAPGPIQPMTFVVPSLSKQRSISEEAAYLAFGLGGGGGKSAPWVDPTFFFVRNAASGTQQMIGAAIGVPGNAWWGKDRGNSTVLNETLRAQLTAETAEKSIGILSADIADSYRGNLRILAYRSRGQTCGFYPDSTANSKDKLNVRDGHYPIWGPVHLFARTNGGTASTAVTTFINRFSATRVDKTLTDAIIDKSLIPQCAMRVTRSAEMGPLASFAPAYQCGCYFDFRTAGASSCKACQVPADCPSNASACNLGYCEAQ
jgi:ABC-type phosphate transport system substrate-binding protein